MADEADNQELAQADGDAATAGAGPSPPPDGSEGAAEEPFAGQPAAEGQEPAAGAAPGSQADPRVDSTGRPFDDTAAAMAAALEEEAASAEKVTLPDFGGPEAQDARESDDVAGEIGILSDVNLNVRIELGRSHMRVEDVLRLGEGSVVELNKLAGDPVDVYVNGHLVARGEVLVLNDNFCVRISEIIGGLVGNEFAEARAG